MLAGTLKSSDAILRPWFSTGIWLSFSGLFCPGDRAQVLAVCWKWWRGRSLAWVWEAGHPLPNSSGVGCLGSLRRQEELRLVHLRTRFRLNCRIMDCNWGNHWISCPCAPFLTTWLLLQRSSHCRSTPLTVVLVLQWVASDSGWIPLSPGLMTALKILHGSGCNCRVLHRLFALYLVLHPATSTPMTLNGVLPSVLSLGKSPGGRLWAGMALNRWHPQQLLRMLFTSFRRRGTQSLSRTLAMVSPAPPCKVTTWARWTALTV